MSNRGPHCSICLIILFLFAAVACGQEGSEPLSLLDVLDADGDGELSAREITRSAPLIRRLDRNKDGRLTGDELNVSDGDDDSDSGSDSNDSDSRSSSRSREDSRSDRASSARTARVSKVAIDGALKRAASFYKRKQFENSGKQIKRAQELIEQLIDDDELDTLEELTEELGRFSRAHVMLKEQGIDLPDAPDLSEFGVGGKRTEKRTSTARPRPTANADGAPTPAGDGTVSFTKEIAPLLVKRCGACHLKDNKGELSLASYSTMMAGSASGDVVAAGNADSSFLVDLVESGDMPPKGEPLSDTELKLIRTWIDEGAVFDGEDEEAKLISK